MEKRWSMPVDMLIGKLRTPGGKNWLNEAADRLGSQKLVVDCARLAAVASVKADGTPEAQHMLRSCVKVLILAVGKHDESLPRPFAQQGGGL